MSTLATRLGILLSFATAVAACGDNLVPEPDAGPQALSPTLETIAPVQVVAGDPIAVTCTLTEGTVDEPITTMVQGELVVMETRPRSRAAAAV